MTTFCFHHAVRYSSLKFIIVPTKECLKVWLLYVITMCIVYILYVSIYIIVFIYNVCPFIITLSRIICLLLLTTDLFFFFSLSHIHINNTSILYSILLLLLAKFDWRETNTSLSTYGMTITTAKMTILVHYINYKKKKMKMDWIYNIPSILSIQQ